MTLRTRWVLIPSVSPIATSSSPAPTRSITSESTELDVIKDRTSNPGV